MPPAKASALAGGHPRDTHPAESRNGFAVFINGGTLPHGEDERFFPATDILCLADAFAFALSIARDLSAEEVQTNSIISDDSDLPPHGQRSKWLRIRRRGTGEVTGNIEVFLHAGSGRYLTIPGLSRFRSATEDHVAESLLVGEAQ